MSDFENEVREQLIKIEAKAEQYITWKMVVTGLFVGVLALLGYGEWQLQRLEGRFDAKIAAMTSELSDNLQKTSQSISKAIVDQNSKRFYPNFVANPDSRQYDVWGQLGAVSTVPIGSDWKNFEVQYYDPQKSQDLVEKWREFLTNEKDVAKFRPITAQWEDFFVQNDSGEFIPASEFFGFSEVKK
ncbi:MAG: hypothetical protein AAGF53_16910 [Pseudomonadota bacterium]